MSNDRNDNKDNDNNSKDKEKEIKDDQNVERLKALLESQHKFPTTYMFKFIVPQTKEAELKNIFPYENIRMNFSKRGKYISITVELLMESSEAVLQVYKAAQSIEGLIAL